MGILGTALTEVTADTDVVSDTLVELLSINFEKEFDESALVLQFTASAFGDTDRLEVNFEVDVDGTLQRGCSASVHNAEPGSTALICKVSGLAKGTRNVRVRWMTQASKVASIHPVSDVHTHASLMVTEVSV